MEVTPEIVAQDIRDCLWKGANSRKSPMHSPVLVTADAQARVLVLRDFDSESMMLRFHTDARSPKVSAIAANPSVTILAYDPDAKVQLRIAGTARIERTSDTAQSSWNASNNFARRCYLAEAAPGSESNRAVSGLPEWADGILPTDEQIAPARENFAILLVQICEVDWLYLAHGGHRRAKIRFIDGGAGDFSWVVP